MTPWWLRRAGWHSGKHRLVRFLLAMARLPEMKRLLPDALFTGYLRGEELADAYASADFFVFPSTTDTFGNVVLKHRLAGSR